MSALTWGLSPHHRACGVETDVRHDFPSGIFRFAQIPISTWQTGRVREAYIRWLRNSAVRWFIQKQLKELPGGPIRTKPKS
jgi:hypothetical protein